MSTFPTPRRHALGMPAGSVRALLGLSVLGMMWILALKYPKMLPPVFQAEHRSAAGDRAPIFSGLPRLVKTAAVRDGS